MPTIKGSLARLLSLLKPNPLPPKSRPTSKRIVMMAFFMVMRIVGMDDKAKDSNEVYFSNPVRVKKGFSDNVSVTLSAESPNDPRNRRISVLIHFRNPAASAVSVDPVAGVVSLAPTDIATLSAP